MKIITFYLPQFHEIPENNEWWGKGFTEWVNVKKAQHLYEGHEQPRVPLNENYYNLLDPNVQVWQAKIAKEYGVCLLYTSGTGGAVACHAGYGHRNCGG